MLLIYSLNHIVCYNNSKEELAQSNQYFSTGKRDVLFLGSLLFIIQQHINSNLMLILLLSSYT